MGPYFAETRSYERLQVVLRVPGFIINAGQGNLRSAVFMIAILAISTVMLTAGALWLIRVLDDGSYSCNFGRGQGYPNTR